MNANRNHNSIQEPVQRVFQRLCNLWQDWLGQLTFIVLAIYALYRWRQWAAIFIAILFIGMFHQRILSIFTEFFACINDFFLGTPTPVNGDVNERSGGLVQGITNVASSLWGWVRKPFQQREPREIPQTTGEGRKAASLRQLADSIDNSKDGFKRRKAEALRRRADLAEEKYRRKQEKLRQKALEDSAKSPLAWTYLIGGVILTALMVVFIAGELVITLQTLLGMMDVPLPRVLDESPLFKSFEVMTAAVLVSAGILFGIYIFDLLGFLPLIPVHLLSISVQRIMLSLIIGCFVGTLVVVVALAAYRSVSLQGGMDVGTMEEPMTDDVTARFEAVPAGVASAPSNYNPTLTTTDMEAKLIFISLVGISLLGLIGAIFAFNGPVVLLMFLSLGVMALISGVTAVFGLGTRLLHWIIMIVYSILHMVLSTLLRMASMVARPFVRLFCLRSTDLNNDAVDNIEPSSEQGEELPPRESPRIVEPPPQNDLQSPPQSDPQSGADQHPFEPSDAEWNPLASKR